MKRIFFTLLLFPLLGKAQTGIITTIAGTGAMGSTGDGGPAVVSKLYNPQNITLDGTGNIYIADGGNLLVRKINTSGVITTIAGNPTAGMYTGDGGPATLAGLDYPTSVAVDGSGNIYITDFWDNVIRKVDASGIISTVAGYGGLVYAGYSGDGGPATAAQLNTPTGVALDGSGNLFIADYSNNVIRVVNSSGIIKTFAGNGITGGSLGDGGPATAGELYIPSGVAVDGSGNVYIADGGNYRIRKVNTSGIITTIAGSGASGFSGDGGPATAAQLNNPYSVSIDGTGNVYIADRDNQRIRKINTSGIINTIAGSGPTGYGLGGFGGDGLSATAALLSQPYGLTVDASGNVYIADFNNNRIRKVTNGIPNIIWGNAIFTGTAIPDSTCKVWLIEYDSATTTLTAVDSTTTCIVSNASFYEFINEPSHNYLIKAALLSGPDSGTGYLPTYHSSSFYWDTANYVTHTGGNDGMENITMKYGIVTGGPGFIAGNVLSGANRGTTTFIPAVNMLILLRNATNDLVAFTYTDASGNYSFSNLANGAYTIYPEDLNFTTTPSSNIDINTSHETETDVAFLQHTVSMTITPESTGINNVTAMQFITIYPNPAINSVTITSSDKISNVTITSLVGQTIYTHNYNSVQVQIDVSALPTGLYFVKVNGSEVRKFVKE